jgi:hypothetical protein
MTTGRGAHIGPLPPFLCRAGASAALIAERLRRKVGPQHSVSELTMRTASALSGLVGRIGSSSPVLQVAPRPTPKK